MQNKRLEPQYTHVHVIVRVKGKAADWKTSTGAWDVMKLKTYIQTVKVAITSASCTIISSSEILFVRLSSLTILGENTTLWGILVFPTYCGFETSTSSCHQESHFDVQFPLEGKDLGLVFNGRKVIKVHAGSVAARCGLKADMYLVKIRGTSAPSSTATINAMIRLAIKQVRGVRDT
eukprot:1318904-Amorphochlora_amoeboformis.AAC.1